CPTIIRRYAEALAIEAEDPIALGDFELVAQPRRLPMIHNPYASQLAVGADAHQQINAAAVTVHGDRRQDHSADAAILPGAPGGSWRRRPQQAGVGYLEAVLQPVVVVLFIRHDFIQRADLYALAPRGDTLAGHLLDEGNDPGGKDGEDAENQAVAQD